jgi:hypothetical protein
VLVQNCYREGDNVIAFWGLGIVLAAKCKMSHTWSSVNPVMPAWLWRELPEVVEGDWQYFPYEEISKFKQNS